MEIYLSHPVHGVKIASLEAEAEQDEGYGWTRFELNGRHPAEHIAKIQNPDDDTPVVNAMPPRRRGRPPLNREG
jgi:hypothetical protein